LTEAASGVYLFNPMIPILAGADRVVTFCRDSHYATVEEVKINMSKAYMDVGLGNSYDFSTCLTPNDLSAANVITNSGHLRPFDAEFLEGLSETAVIPLMWEPWELRAGEIDLEVARRRKILVMGTNEHEDPCDMRPYSFLTAIRLMMDHQVTIVQDNILVIGDQVSLALPIDEGFSRLGYACKRLSLSADFKEMEEKIRWATYILVAEHKDHRMLLGANAWIKTKQLVKANINGVGVIAGTVDREDLEVNGISVYPGQVAKPGYMSYLPSELGPYPVMKLFAAGVKVGQVMANARLLGLSLSESARVAINRSPAMDLKEKWSWI
jgi:hypothetical protein